MLVVSLFLILRILPSFQQETGIVRNDSYYGDEHRNQTCVVPPYSLPLYEVNSTDVNTELLFTNGRCYLTCQDQYSVSALVMKLFM